MEEAKNAANGGDAVKKKSFLITILISKWFVITVLILGFGGYATWWGMNSWKDFTAKKDGQLHETQVAQETDSAHDTFSTAKDDTHGAQATHQSADETQTHTIPHTAFNETAEEDRADSHESTTGHGTMHAAPVRIGPRGVAFVEACIKPLGNELNHRFWGWRPNDIVRFTDNINNLQLGVLEVTRRTAVALAENLSRTGRADAYVPGLEYAMNSFMIKPTEYMFPSAESKYQEGLDEWRNYQNMLKKREAHFYRRVDNLVPLLKAYESILGSCDENLVKELGKISTFKADDVFYYTKGVATAMGTILEAVAQDFDDTLSVQGTEVLHHAVEALHHASHMDPWIVLEGNPDGIFANHRANTAASISHARFYLDVLSRSLTGNL